MCSQQDDPTQYDAPIPSRPRKYELSGAIDLSGSSGTSRGSIALAVLGDMLDYAERQLDATDSGRFPLLWDIRVARVDILREARDAIAKAEAEA